MVQAYVPHRMLTPKRVFVGFYKGRIAEAIVSSIQERGGIMTAEDLSAHKCEHREPIMSTYRGYHIYEVAPPTAVSLVSVRAPLNGWGMSE